jgi:predicted HTH domain antitoxin
MGMRHITIDVPEELVAAEGGDAAAFARELALLAAVKLYELGRLSSGCAAELAGITRVAFLDALKRYRVFPLEAELGDLESGRV